MSKTLLSRIKPFTNPPPPPSLTPQLKQQITNTLTILKTQQNWSHSLNLHQTSHISPYLFDRIKNIETGLKLFDYLFKNNSFTNGSSYLHLLARHRAFNEIEHVMSLENLTFSHESLSHVLHAYSESGLLEKALEVYGYVVEPDVIACNSLLSLLVKSKRVRDARKVFDEMSEREIGDNYSTCIIVRGLCGEGKVEEGRRLIEERYGEGCVPNVVFYNVVIDGYCKIGDVESASLVFKELKSKGFMPTLETFGTLVNGFCKKGYFVASDRLLKEMKERGLVVSVRFLNSIMDAKYRRGVTKVEVAESMRWIEASGCKPDIATYNILINRLCKEGKMEEAVRLLDEASKKGLIPNNITYSPLIQAYCRIKEYDIASKLLLQLAESGIKPDVVTYGIIIHGLVVSGNMDDAVEMKGKLIDRGVSPDAAIYNMLMSGLCKSGRFLPAKDLFAEMLDRKITPDAYVYATLIDGFVRSRDFDEARKVFILSIEKGVKVDVVHYNAMIKGFCRSGMLNEALICMNRMTEEKLVPDAFTYSTIIDGYVKQQDMATALKIFRDMRKSKCKPNVVTYSSLVNGFCREGDFEMAEETFKEMQSCSLVPNVVTYTTLIKSFAKDGSTLGKAVYYWELMLRNNVVPNDVTFNCLLEGFVKNTSGIVLAEPNGLNGGQSSLFAEFFDLMKSEGWSVHAAAYNSVLVGLSVHGMVQTACRFQDKMVKKGFSPDPVSFAAILHGFCVVGNSKQWSNTDFCSLDEKGLEVAVRYSRVIERHLPQAVILEASTILHAMVHNTDNKNLRVVESQ